MRLRLLLPAAPVLASVLTSMVERYVEHEGEKEFLPRSQSRDGSMDVWGKIHLPRS